jgi:small subunit ribosomal protein S16
MATTIRLTRMGRKQAPFYRLVVCDSRTRRDGDYIESLGYYNPMPDAYQLEVDHTKAVDWLGKGAQPTTTAKSLLRNEGVLLRWHLMKSGTAVDDIDSQVEAYRSRRASQADAIKAQSAAKLKAEQDEREAVAKKKKAAAAKATEAVAEEAAAEEATEEAVAEAPAEGDAEAPAEEPTEEKS